MPIVSYGINLTCMLGTFQIVLMGNCHYQQGQITGRDIFFVVVYE
jgi:hypothetical protein